MSIQSKIQNAQTIEELTWVIENAEPRQENGEKTAFHRHLDDTLWFHLDTLDKMKTFALKVCEHHNK